MAWADKDDIRVGVLSMCSTNLAVRPGESILVLTDPPTLSEWVREKPDDLKGMIKRNFTAKIVAEIIAEEYRDNPFEFYPFPATARSGVEPPPEVAAKMRASNVVIAITNKSLSHTDARVEACRSGARVASMPGFLARMVLPDGAMGADYERIAVVTASVADQLTRAGKVRVISPMGTDITFDIDGRQANVDDGILRMPGAFGNLPGGEAYIAPVEGSAEGTLVALPGWAKGLAERMAIGFHAGRVVSVEGGADFGEYIVDLLGLARSEREQDPFWSRRNLAEFGVGTNPQARLVESLVEAEKIGGTIHLALGDNAHMGGLTTADYHRDFVIPEPTVWLDGTMVIDKGQYVGPWSAFS